MICVLIIWFDHAQLSNTTAHIEKKYADWELVLHLFPFLFLGIKLRIVVVKSA